MESLLLVPDAAQVLEDWAQTLQEAGLSTKELLSLTQK